MKHLLAFLFVGIIALSSCDLDGTNPGDKRLRVYADASISEEYPHVISGDNLVFHFYYQHPDEENIADDEFTEEFFLEVVPNGNSFSFSSEQMALDDVTMWYEQYCFCGQFNRLEVTGFDIEGTKVGDNWSLSGTADFNLQFVNPDTDEVLDSFPRSVTISGVYSPGAYELYNQ